MPTPPKDRNLDVYVRDWQVIELAVTPEGEEPTALLAGVTVHVLDRDALIASGTFSLGELLDIEEQVAAKLVEHWPR
jgi:hypothetical protein